MFRSIRSIALSAALLAVLLPTPSLAEQIVFDFLNHDDVVIGQSWTEQGLTLVVAPTGGGATAVAGRFGISLVQAVLSIDMQPLTGVRLATAEVVTTTGPNTTSVMLLDGEDGLIDSVVNADTLHTEFLTVRAGDETARYFQVGGTNVRLISVTIEHGAVPTDEMTWSGVKTLYR